jgi:hypothetical protein
VVRQSPQEKKQLSYKHDRRNTYGENDKSSRKAIPFRKRAVNKANRHADHQILLEATGIPDLEADDRTDDRVHGGRRKRWRKWPDQRLGEILANRRRREPRPDQDD